MNIKMKQLIFPFFVVLGFLSCKKEENKVIYEGGTAPVLSTSNTGTVVLIKDKRTENALTLSWTNPNYMFNTGISSQNVNYVLQIDTAGKNFVSSKLQEMSIPSDLGVKLTAQQLNTFLSKMEFKSGVDQSIDIRVKSTMANKSAALTSNTLTVKVNPYLDFAVEPPGTEANNYNDGNLWLLGDAVASGFSNPLPSPYGGYKLIQTQGVWGTQYHALDGSVGAALSGSFEKKDSDPTFPGPSAGTYKVQINFQTGKYTLTKL